MAKLTKRLLRRFQQRAIREARTATKFARNLVQQALVSHKGDAGCYAYKALLEAADDLLDAALRLREADDYVADYTCCGQKGVS